MTRKSTALPIDMTNYEEFRDSAVEAYKSLPEEMDPLYTRNHINLQLGKEIRASTDVDGESRRFREAYGALSKDLNAVEELRFDAAIGSTSSILSNPSVVSLVSPDELGYELINRKMHSNTEDKFAALIHANTREFVVIDVPEGKKAHINIAFVNTESPLVTQVLIRVGKNAKLKLTEFMHSKTAEHSLLGIMNEISSDNYSSVELGIVHNEGPSTKVLNFCKGLAGEGSSMRINFVYNGGSMVRSKNNVSAAGRSSNIEVRELAFSSSDQKFDINTVVRNAAEESNTLLESKAAVKDSSLCLLKGFARIDYGAKGSRSYVSERGLIVDKGAKIESLPSMAIDESEVKATHSSATAQVSEESLFYLAARGIPESLANRLVLTGFFAETLYKMEDSMMKVMSLAMVKEKLDGLGFGHVPKITEDDVLLGSMTQRGINEMYEHYKFRQQAGSVT